MAGLGPIFFKVDLPGLICECEFCGSMEEKGIKDVKYAHVVTFDDVDFWFRPPRRLTWWNFWIFRRIRSVVCFQRAVRLRISRRQTFFRPAKDDNDEQNPADDSAAATTLNNTKQKGQRNLV